MLHSINISRLLSLLLALPLLMAGATACDSSADGPVDNGEEPAARTSIGLYLTIPTLTDEARIARTPSLNPGEDGYDPGEGYENYIDLAGNDYRIYVFTPDNRLYTAVSNSDVDIVSYNFTQFSRIYGLSFPVDQDFFDRFDGKALKLVVLANWHNTYPEATQIGGSALADESQATTLDDLVNASQDEAGFMDYTPVTPSIAHDSRIPLYGVTEFTTVKLQNGLLTWLGDVRLLRALAKVEIYDRPDSDLKIESVSLSRFNTSLAKAPAKVKTTSDYVHNAYIADYVSTPTIPTRTDGNGSNFENSSPISLSQTDNGHFIVYVPEYRNLLSGTPRQDSERMRLVVRYAGEDPYYVDFKYYSYPPSTSSAKLGDYFDVLRNVWYQFEVNHSRYTFDVEVIEQPYSGVNLNPDFGLNRDEDGYLIDSDGNRLTDANGEWIK